MIMEQQNKLDINTLLEQNLEVAEQTLRLLKEQEEQLNNSTNSLSNIEYYSKKSKDILKRMDGFFKRLWHRPVDIDIEKEYNLIQMDEIIEEKKSSEGGEILDKLGKLKEMGIKIGENLDNQNIMLEKIDFETDKNKSYLDKNNRKINKLL